LVARRVSFRLNINAVKAQSILIDDAIDASIARTAKLRGSILMCAPVSHCDQEIDDDPFEEARTILQDTLQKIISKGRLKGEVPPR